MRHSLESSGGRGARAPRRGGWRWSLVLFGGAMAACFRISPSKGGGQVEGTPERRVNPEDVVVPDGYRVEVVTTGLTYPTSITFDADNRPYVVEAGYSYGESFVTARLSRIEPDGTTKEIARGDNGPWTGAWYHEGHFLVAEGGVTEGGRIVRIGPNGARQVLVEGLPSFGDHHTNGPVVGRDGFIYFGQGTATNSGVVGEDNARFGWLARHPDFHDIPCQDVTLTGVNFTSKDVVSSTEGEVETGPFLPFGTRSAPGQVIAGRVPCSGAVLRLPVAGGAPELVAWGFRNPFGLAFDLEQRLYVTDNAYDVRGSRPVFGTPDVLWRVEPGRWYGWPDFAEGQRVDAEDYEPPGGSRPPRLLLRHPGRPPMPVAEFPVHSSSNGLDFSGNAAFGFVGQAFVAEFGDQAPGTGKVMAPVGFRVTRVEVDTGVSHAFAINRGDKTGPASLLGTGGLERPVSVRFDRAGEALYVVDFGVLAMDGKASKPKQRTGVIWRIRREGRR